MSQLLPLLHEKLSEQGFSYISNVELKEPERFDYYEIRLEKLFKSQVVPDKLKKHFFSIEVSKPQFIQKEDIDNFKISFNICLGESHPKLGQVIGVLEYNFVTSDHFFSEWGAIKEKAEKFYQAILVLEEDFIK